MAKSKRLKRTELYALVWSKAMIHVAKELGMSGVGMAKLCRRHDVPVPWRGYWALLQHGHKPTQTSLPPLPQGQDPWITVTAFVELAGKAGEREHRASEAAQAEFTPEYRVTVNEAVTDLHHNLRATAGDLRKRKPDETGRIKATGNGHFSVYVSPANVERAIRILHALCAGFDHREYAIVRKPGEIAQSLRVAVNGESIGFSLEERVRQVHHEPTAAELARTKREPWFKVGKYDHEPTGAFVLRLENLPVHGNHPPRWADTQKIRIEERLNEFMAGLLDSAIAMKAWREEQDRQRLEREERQRREAEQEARAQTERARMRFLEEQANLWHRRERIRLYLEAVRARLGSVDQHSPEEKARAAEWIDWADAYLRTRDPATLPFFNVLVQPGTRLFDAYAWRGNYGDRDAWFDVWGS